MIREKLEKFAYKHGIEELVYKLGIIEPPVNLSYITTLTPDYRNKKGVVPSLDRIADSFFDSLGYDPRSRTTEYEGYVQKVDNSIFKIFQALRGDTNPEEPREDGIWYRTTKRQTWQTRGREIKSLFGNGTDNGLLYDLKKALDLGKISEDSAKQRLEVLKEMLDTALVKNKYLKTTYGEGVKSTEFYKNSLDSLEKVQTLVENHDYSKVHGLAGILKLKPFAVILENKQYENIDSSNRTLEFGPFTDLLDNIQIAYHEKQAEVFGAIGKKFRKLKEQIDWLIPSRNSKNTASGVVDLRLNIWTEAKYFLLSKLGKYSTKGLLPVQVEPTRVLEKETSEPVPEKSSRLVSAVLSGIPVQINPDLKQSRVLKSRPEESLQEQLAIFSSR